jgi:hypothetical protein
MILSNLLFCDLSNLVRHLRQYPCNDPDISTKSRTARLNHLLRKDQTCCVYGQSLHRWFGVSGSAPHSLQIGSLDQLRLAKLLTVRIFLCSRVQAKNGTWVLLLLSKWVSALTCYSNPQTECGMRSWLCIRHSMSIATELYLLDYPLSELPSQVPKVSRIPVSLGGSAAVVCVLSIYSVVRPRRLSISFFLIT